MLAVPAKLKRFSVNTVQKVTGVDSVNSAQKATGVDSVNSSPGVRYA